MPPLIPTPKIASIDVGSPTRKPNELPEEPLVPPPSELFITQSSHQIISFILSQEAKDKGKSVVLEPNIAMKLSKKFEGRSKEELQQALDENICIQAIKDNPNPMMGISSLFRE